MHERFCDFVIGCNIFPCFPHFPFCPYTIFLLSFLFLFFIIIYYYYFRRKHFALFIISPSFFTLAGRDVLVPPPLFIPYRSKNLFSGSAPSTDSTFSPLRSKNLSFAWRAHHRLPLSLAPFENLVLRLASKIIFPFPSLSQYEIATVPTTTLTVTVYTEPIITTTTTTTSTQSLMKPSPQKSSRPSFEEEIRHIRTKVRIRHVQDLLRRLEASHLNTAGDMVELTDRLVRFETLRQYPDVHVRWDSCKNEESQSIVVITEVPTRYASCRASAPAARYSATSPCAKPQPAPCPRRLRRYLSPDTLSREASPQIKKKSRGLS